MMNILLAVAAIGAVLVGYNAFVATNDDGHSATDHIAEYLKLDVAKLEKSDDGLGDLSVDKPADVTPDGTITAEVGDKADASKPSAPASPGTGKAESVYTVKDGDTYGCIAEKYYGSFEHWVDVINANPGGVGFAEYELHVGARIVLPAVSSTSLKPASTLCS